MVPGTGEASVKRKQVTNQTGKATATVCPTQVESGLHAQAWGHRVAYVPPGKCGRSASLSKKSTFEEVCRGGISFRRLRQTGELKPWGTSALPLQNSQLPLHRFVSRGNKVSNCPIVFTQACNAPVAWTWEILKRQEGGKEALFGSKPFHLKSQPGLLMLIGKSTQTLLCGQFQRNNKFLC